MIEKAHGLIFDLDGTIIDSSWVWDMVDIKFLGDRGFQVPEDYVETISPMGAENAAVYTIERLVPLLPIFPCAGRARGV